MSNKVYKKATIPKALREQVWISNFGKKFQHKCYIDWCENIITVFDFQCGHDTAEKHGGKTVLENLKPICSRCNLSMSSNYNIAEFNKLGTRSGKKRCFQLSLFLKSLFSSESVGTRKS